LAFPRAIVGKVCGFAIAGCQIGTRPAR
jgi:hypothetical protein